MSDENGILLEDINHKLDAILEWEGSFTAMSEKLNNVDQRLILVEADVKIIKKVVTAQSHDLRNHDNRLRRLEQPA